MIHIPKDCREEFLPLNTQGTELCGRRGIQLAGISSLTEGYMVDRSECSFSLLLCVLAGEGECDLNKQTFPLNRGDIMFMQHGTDHCYRSRGDWEILWFHLKREQWGETGEPAWIRSREDLISSLFPVFRTYMRESLIDQGGPIIPSLGEVLINMIGRIISLASPQSARGRGGRILATLKKEVQKNLSRNWTVEDLACTVNISSPYLYRITREEEDTTPLGLLKRMRMELASQLLRHSDYPLQYIAERIGYSTAYAFTKAFKKEYGQSPGKYRNG